MNYLKQTIVIPTRNRSETAIYAIESCIRSNYENKEIIVADNSDDMRLYELLKSKQWLNKVIYNKTNTTLSMRDNWEFGLELSTGDLVSIMGDDDALLSESMSIANYAFNNLKIDVLTGSEATYKWGSYPLQGRRHFLKFGYGEQIKIQKSPKNTLKMAYEYNIEPGTGPGLYYGFVKREFLNKIKQQRGRYLVDQVPDFDSGYATFLYANSYAYAERPLFIQGHSGKSNSGAMRYTSTQRKHISQFAIEIKNGYEIFNNLLKEIKSNNSVIVSAQIRFLEEVCKELGENFTSLNKKGAFEYLIKGLLENYDAVQFIAAIPHLKTLAKEWGIPYSIKNEYTPSTIDSSLAAEQGFSKSNTKNESITTEIVDYRSMVVNGAKLNFDNIMDAVKLVDSILPTMRAFSNTSLHSEAIANAKKIADLKIKEIRKNLSINNFGAAKNLFEEVLALGQDIMNLDLIADEIYSLNNNLEDLGNYYARRFSGTGNPEQLKKLISIYQRSGKSELASSLIKGLEQISPKLIKELT